MTERIVSSRNVSSFFAEVMSKYCSPEAVIQPRQEIHFSLQPMELLRQAAQTEPPMPYTLWLVPSAASASLLSSMDRRDKRNGRRGFAYSLSSSERRERLDRDTPVPSCQKWQAFRSIVPRTGYQSDSVDFDSISGSRPLQRSAPYKNVTPG